MGGAPRVRRRAPHGFECLIEKFLRGAMGINLHKHYLYYAKFRCQILPDISRIPKLLVATFRP